MLSSTEFLYGYRHIVLTRMKLARNTIIFWRNYNANKTSNGTKVYLDHTSCKGTLKFLNPNAWEAGCAGLRSHRRSTSGSMLTFCGLREKDRRHPRKHRNGLRKTRDEIIFFQRAELGLTKERSPLLNSSWQNFIALECLHTSFWKWGG